MNIAVCVKCAIDEAEVKADASGAPQTRGAQTKMSTFDKNAVEEAVRLREKHSGSNVTVVSLGVGDGLKKTVKEAMAMGCDKGLVLVSGVGGVSKDDSTKSTEVEWSMPDTLSTAYYLSRGLQRLGDVELVICSEGASDTYDGVVGAMVAEWMGLPFMGYVRKVEVSGNAGSKPTTIRCEMVQEDDIVVAEAALPAVISVVSEINSPRYPTLLQIMQASKKPIEEVPLDTLRDDRVPVVNVKIVEVRAQSVERKRVIFEEAAVAESAKKLVDALAKEGVI